VLAIITSHPIQYQAPLWRELARAGIKFEVWFLTPHAVQASYDREFGRSFAWDVDLLEGYPHRFLDVADGWRLDRFGGIRLLHGWPAELRSHGVTRIWVEGWRFRAFWQTIQAAHRAGIEVWMRGENHDLAPEPWLRRLWRRPILRWLLGQVDRFLCIGTSNRRFYRQLGIDEARLSAAPYCVDNARFARAAVELRPRRAALRAQWQIAPGACCVLFCGKLIPKKRPLDLLAAARLLSSTAARPLHLLFAGDGQQAPMLRQALVRPGGPPGTITGFLNQKEIVAAYAAADCLVLPSDYGETWGLVVNEALASDLPAVVSDRCGCAEDLGLPQGPNYVYPCGDESALARSLSAAQECPPPAAKLRKIIDAHAPARTVDTVRQLLSAQ
jgi:glycosyltransferase involved in cell wall biosynthesis